MARTKLPERRPSITCAVNVCLDGGRIQKVLVTVGFADNAMTEAREVFCADFKSGTAIHSIVMDACILLSRCLQHGDTAVEIAAALCTPPSLIGSIAAAVLEATLRRDEYYGKEVKSTEDVESPGDPGGRPIEGGHQAD